MVPCQKIEISNSQKQKEILQGPHMKVDNVQYQITDYQKEIILPVSDNKSTPQISQSLQTQAVTPKVADHLTTQKDRKVKRKRDKRSKNRSKHLDDSKRQGGFIHEQEDNRFKPIQPFLIQSLQKQNLTEHSQNNRGDFKQDNASLQNFWCHNTPMQYNNYNHMSAYGQYMPAFQPYGYADYSAAIFHGCQGGQGGHAGHHRLP